ncbi:MAG: NnrU family protein [Acidiferrobacterales bacterium]
MNTMLLFLILASVAMIATHVVPALPSIRQRLVGMLGERGYQGVFTLVALVAITAMVYAFNRSPLEFIWEPGPIVKRLPAVLMPLAFILLVTGLLTRNPTMFGQESRLDSDTPARGIVRITRYPFIWATILWSVSHIAANGDIASIVFFGGFLGLAVFGAIGIDKKRAAKYGEQWTRFADVTSNIPFAAILSGRNRLVWSEVGWTKPVIGIAAYVAMILAHRWLFGVMPY